MLNTAITILLIVAYWRMFERMGMEGWECLIPFYGPYVIFRQMYGNGWRFLLLLIPIYNIYVYCKLCIDIAHNFGQSSAFGAGLILVNPIFVMLLAFGNYEYRF